MLISLDNLIRRWFELKVFEVFLFYFMCLNGGGLRVMVFLDYVNVFYKLMMKLKISLNNKFKIVIVMVFEVLDFLVIVRRKSVEFVYIKVEWKGSLFVVVLGYVVLCNLYSDFKEVLYDRVVIYDLIYWFLYIGEVLL